MEVYTLLFLDWEPDRIFSISRGFFTSICLFSFIFCLCLCVLLKELFLTKILVISVLQHSGWCSFMKQAYFSYFRFFFGHTHPQTRAGTQFDNCGDATGPLWEAWWKEEWLQSWTVKRENCWKLCSQNTGVSKCGAQTQHALWWKSVCSNWQTCKPPGNLVKYCDFTPRASCVNRTI